MVMLRVEEQMTIFLSIALIKWNTFRAKVTITTSHSDNAVFTFYKEYINITMNRFRQVKYINAQFTNIYNQFRNLKVLTFFTFFLSLYYHVFIVLVFICISYAFCLLIQRLTTQGTVFTWSLHIRHLEHLNGALVIHRIDLCVKMTVFQVGKISQNS